MAYCTSHSNITAIIPYERSSPLHVAPQSTFTQQSSSWLALPKVKIPQVAKKLYVRQRYVVCYSDCQAPKRNEDYKVALGTVNLLQKQNMDEKQANEWQALLTVVHYNIVCVFPNIQEKDAINFILDYY